VQAPTPAERVVGLRPWFPWPLSRWRWLTQPVPAERLAALRIGLAAVLLHDLFTTYVGHVGEYFAPDSLGGRVLFAYNLNTKQPWKWTFHEVWNWSLLGAADEAVLQWAMLGFVAATFCLMIGFLTRVSAAFAWALSLSFANLNGYIDNAGDQVRGIILFYLMLCPAGAVWSVDAWLRHRRAGSSPRVKVYPWVLRLLFLQLVLIYFLNGLSKVVHEDWRDGRSLYFVLTDLSLSRLSYAQFPVPFLATRLMTWAVLVWEAGFPLWVALPWTRKPALWMGVAFHLGIYLSMEIGFFVPYMLTLYLPLLPWERWRGRCNPPAAGLQKEQ
jgi:hypothetical protein